MSEFSEFPIPRDVTALIDDKLDAKRKELQAFEQDLKWQAFIFHAKLRDASWKFDVKDSKLTCLGEIAFNGRYERDMIPLILKQFAPDWQVERIALTGTIHRKFYEGELRYEGYIKLETVEKFNSVEDLLRDVDHPFSSINVS